MKRPFPYGNDDGYEAVSASECTGLIPSEPYDGEELRSYSDLYDLPLPQHSNDRRLTMNEKKKNRKPDDDSQKTYEN